MTYTFSRVAALGGSIVAACLFAACAGHVPPSGAQQGKSPHKEQAAALLKSIETGDPNALALVDPGKYIQHNLAIADGVAGMKAAFSQIPKGSAKVNIVRLFQDGDFVFAHSEYDIFGQKIGFDIFRFEDGKIVEHWDNLQAKPAAPNPSGRTMTDGPTLPTDLDKTQANKMLVRSFVEDVLMNGRMDRFAGYFSNGKYLQHNPHIGDDLSGLGAAMKGMAQRGIRMKYDRIHKVLGEGNFVLVVSEGEFAGKPTSYYDLFRVEGGKIAEHWDTVQAIPPRAEWKNANGKF